MFPKYALEILDEMMSECTEERLFSEGNQESYARLSKMIKEAIKIIDEECE